MKINDVCFDRENKELVMISNGIDVGGEFIPTEAVAIRYLGINDKKNKPCLAYTHRKVKKEFLEISEGDKSIFTDLFDAGKKIGFIGRV